MANFDFIKTKKAGDFGTSVSDSCFSIHFYNASVIWEEERIWDAIKIKFTEGNPVMVYFYSNFSGFSGGVADKTLTLSDCYKMFMWWNERN